MLGFLLRSLNLWPDGKSKDVTAHDIAITTQVKHILETASFVIHYRQAIERRGFYSFEEDLPHHIYQCCVITSTGVGVFFFNNHYISEMLNAVNDHQCQH